MASSNNGSFEVILALKHDGKNYAPGAPISGLKKEQSEPLVLKGVIGSKGSYKKSLEEKEVLELGQNEDILELVKGFKAEIAELKSENKELSEAIAKK